MPYARIFERLSTSGQARFVAIGIDAQRLGLPMEPILWTEETEVASIFSFDVGIMPLTDAPFERGKCGYKLIQYMACGLPVVASPIGVNCHLVEHGVNGFLAETHEQWSLALQTLISNHDLRQSMVATGRQKVERQYSTQVTGPKLIAILQQAAKSNK
jgi:glycosyltransferase involved in cell wall biosynthesis